MSDISHGSMDENDPYPVPCPFCAIASAYPPASSSSSSSSSTSSPSALSSSSRDRSASGTTQTLLDAIPEAPDAEKVQPGCFLLLSAPEVLAFLDIQPMTRGHVLVASRRHRRKVEDLRGWEGRDIGFWLPLLARAIKSTIGVSDYNIVQNNGIRAAQVVPHVHFHIIPRPSHVPELKARSWTMFGRGQREDLDDEEAASLAESIREALRREVEGLAERESKL